MKRWFQKKKGSVSVIPIIHELSDWGGINKGRWLKINKVKTSDTLLNEDLFSRPTVDVVQYEAQQSYN